MTQQDLGLPNTMLQSTINSLTWNHLHSLQHLCTSRRETCLRPCFLPVCTKSNTRDDLFRYQPASMLNKIEVHFDASLHLSLLSLLVSAGSLSPFFQLGFEYHTPNNTQKTIRNTLFFESLLSVLSNQETPLSLSYSIDWESHSLSSRLLYVEQDPWCGIQPKQMLKQLDFLVSLHSSSCHVLSLV